MVNSQKVSLEKNIIHKQGSCPYPTVQAATENIELLDNKGTFADMGSILESFLLFKASRGDEFS